VPSFIYFKDRENNTSSQFENIHILKNPPPVNVTSFTEKAIQTQMPTTSATIQNSSPPLPNTNPFNYYRRMIKKSLLYDERDLFSLPILQERLTMHYCKDPVFLGVKQSS
jgi:hypothetical protein